ncbi:PhzF family phenazine biosynthesis protein [Mycolicibacterium smegmatis]|uniref:PhzF family phenazine biosynthesis protein n=1 Tax=Mycolicibacterium smegmatis TaxID=1772 RepID=UPI00235344CD|nr:PhzF family phenazine biosynthesis isomerase [Mycolicibacterium smegmatis]
MDLAYSHVDVFSRVPFGGNSLPVFPDARGVSSEQMLRITQEMRHFETIFLEPSDRPDTVRARIFDLFDELPFAGHPIIGAAAVLHRRSGIATPRTWRFHLAATTVEITTESTAAGFSGVLDQGTPVFLGQVDDRDQVAAAFDLVPDDLAADLPMEVVSTGLRYLIVPVGPAPWRGAGYLGTSPRCCVDSAPSSRCCSTNPPSRYGTGTTTASSRTSRPVAPQE